MLLCSHSFSSRAVGLHAFLPSLATLALALCTPSAHAQMPRIELSAGLNRIEAEVAANMSDRMQGLMHRQSLPANHGMLFVYPQAQTHCMWMRNTLIPLSEAFLDDSGRIINFSSSVVGLLQPGYGMYAASKAAIEALTSVLAKELRGRNITVNAVAPGPTATGLFLDGKTPELIERLAKMAPLERLGTPEDIAAAVAFLAGADGGWINGQTLRANGGII